MSGGGTLNERPTRNRPGGRAAASTSGVVNGRSATVSSMSAVSRTDRVSNP
jgi:hypothetical protein